MTRTKMIRTFADLLDHFGADSPRGLNRRLYKDTACGASISVCLVDGAWVHNGDRKWDTMTADTPIVAFTIQTIIEGSDATVDSDEFRLPVAVADVDGWITYMEAEAALLWQEANEDESEAAHDPD